MENKLEYLFKKRKKMISTSFLIEYEHQIQNNTEVTLEQINRPEENNREIRNRHRHKWDFDIEKAMFQFSGNKIDFLIKDWYN